MDDKTNKILCDIGGTFCRFALAEGGAPSRIRKYEASLHASFLDALKLYCADEGLAPGGRLYMAVAGYEEGGVWKFTNKNAWQISPADLKASGWDVAAILNDFAANVLSLKTLPGDDLECLKQGVGASGGKCLVGPGTGLGLGYLHDSPHGAFVQRTHGGQIPLAAMNDEQAEIASIVRRIKERDTILVSEDVVSGYGLLNLYMAVCERDGVKPAIERVRDLPAQARGNVQIEAALRLFHEFFAQFSATCVITGHAYGGLYLAGGVLERLCDAGLFDFALFEKHFLLNGVEAVRHDLSQTPIYRILDPTPALKGLMNA